MTHPFPPKASEGTPTPTESGASTAGLSAYLRAARVDMLYERNVMPAAMTLPFGPMLVAATWPLLDRRLLVLWFAFKIPTAALRLWLHRAYRRRRPSDPPRVWERRYVIALLLDALSWTLLGPYFARADQLIVLSVIVCSVIGVGAVGIVALSTHRLGSLVFGSALFLPTAVHLLAQGAREEVFAGASILLYYLLMMDYGRRSAIATDELLQLRFEIGEARDQALAAARAKTDFLATMSHELRTPLNAMLGMATLLGTGDLSATQRSRVQIIKTSGEALLSLIGDILDFSKIDTGKLEMERVPVPLVRCVEESLLVVSMEAAKKGLDLSYELIGDVPEAVLTDPTRLKQILLNLLSNAVKFTSKGSVVVRVCEGGEADFARSIAFTVTDTGIGVTPDAIQVLFAPFSQADASIVRRFGGTGLGLAISKRLCEALGGEISVESAEGVGSTFRFTITAASAPRDAALSPSLRGRALVVSDRVEMATRLAGLLSRLGMQSEAASEQGIQVSSEDPSGSVLLFDFRDDERLKAALREHLDGAASPSLRAVILVDPGRELRLSDPRARLLERPFCVDRFVACVSEDKGVPAEAKARSEPVEADTGALVLVVDDYELNRLVTVQFLRRLGYQTAEVASGAAAIAFARSRRVDVILMDLLMPELDGDLTTKMLFEALQGEPRPCVIGLTASALAEDCERCLSAGMVDYLVKPIRIEALGAALAKSRPHWPAREPSA